MESQKIVFGARGSALALAQTRTVIRELEERHPHLVCSLEIITTTGDQIQHVPLTGMSTQGVFVSELEQALLNGKIDVAVHSLKDLPTKQPQNLCIAATPPREDPRDVLFSKNNRNLAELEKGFILGTSSARRGAQIKHLRPDALLKDIRGNVDTRMKKVVDGQYDATILAAAGIVRLGLTERVSYYFGVDEMLPAPAQGALALEIAGDRPDLMEILQTVECPQTRAATISERTVLETLGSGCSLPLAAYAEIRSGRLLLKARVVSADGEQVVEAKCEGRVEDAAVIGRTVGNNLIKKGAAEIIETAESHATPGAS